MRSKMQHLKNFWQGSGVYGSVEALSLSAGNVVATIFKEILDP